MWLSGPIMLAGAHAGQEMWRLPLPHGIDPGEAVAGAVGAGTELVRTPTLPLPCVTRESSGQLVLTYEMPAACRPPTAALVARSARPRHAPGLTIGPQERAVPVQRVAASVLVWARGALLATRYSSATSAPGAWALPGGGVDPHEDPREGARRECWEETGQSVLVGELVRVFSRHWVGRAPTGRLEDFHALSLVFCAHCSRPTETVVHDVGGSTADAAWVAATEVGGLGWAAAHRWVGSLQPPERGSLGRGPSTGGGWAALS